MISTAATYTVYWRTDDRRIHVWKTGLAHAEVQGWINRCETAHPEAAFVWAINDDEATAYRMQEESDRQAKRDATLKSLDIPKPPED